MMQQAVYLPNMLNALNLQHKVHNSKRNMTDVQSHTALTSINMQAFFTWL